MLAVVNRSLKLILLFLSVPVAVFAQEPQQPDQKPLVRHESCATGKVLSVERHGDRFAVEVSIGADDGIRAGLENGVYIGPNMKLQPDAGFPTGYAATGQVVEVHGDRATCNIGPSRNGKRPSAPQIGDPVFIRRWHPPVMFVVAKHVVIHDGKICDLGQYSRSAGGTE